MKNILLAAAALSTVCLGGCATVINGRYQNVLVASKPNGAQCMLYNDKGRWTLTTPTTLNIHRSIRDLSIDCTKAHYYESKVFVHSQTQPMVGGNIFAGGILGAGIDTINGSAFNYPNVITVPLTHKPTHKHRA